MCENIYIDIYRYKIIFTYILHSTEPSWLQKGQRNFVAKNTFFFVTTFFCFFLLLPIFVSYTCYNVLFLLSYCSVLFLVYIRLYIVFRDDIKFINIHWWLCAHHQLHHFNFYSNLSSVIRLRLRLLSTSCVFPERISLVFQKRRFWCCPPHVLIVSAFVIYVLLCSAI